MKVKFISLLLIMWMGVSQSLHAQDDQGAWTVKGVLVDSVSHEGEPYATIRIFASDDSVNPVRMAVTDGNGHFQESLKEPDTYIIYFSSVGKGVVSRTFSVSEKNRVADLGKVLMAESAEMLKGVEVVVHKPLVKADIDKLTYNVEDDPDSKMSTILEMLRKVPFITVDGEENIYMKGSKSFKVYVNGRPNNMMSSNPKEVLRSLPADMVKSIEVITEPGAKYDAEGVGGILNIVMVERSGMEGYSATLSASANNMGGSAGAYATVQLGKLTLTGNYSYDYIDMPKRFSESGREDFASEEYRTLSNSSWSKAIGNMQMGSVEGSYEIDTLNLLSFSMDLMGMDDKSYGSGTTLMLDALQQQAYSYRTMNRGVSGFQSIGASLDYQHSFRKKGEYLTLSYRYSGSPQYSEAFTEYEDIKDYPYDMDYLRNQHFDNNARTDEHTLQVDYTNPINQVHDLAVGAKVILRDNTSNGDYYKEYDGGYELDNELTEHFDHSQNILAAYADYKMAWKQWSARAGVRYEHTFMDVEYNHMADKDFETDFDDVVPSMAISYQLAPTQTLRASYNMRISRPSIWYLNPFRDASNPAHINYGNPDLDTEKMHRLGVTYSAFSAKLSVNASLNYSFTDNGIEQYSFIDNGVMNTTFGNVGQTKRTSLSLWMNWNPGRKTRISVNGEGDYVDYQSNQSLLKMENSGFNGSLFLNVQQTLPWNIRLSLNGHGSTPRITLQGKGMSFFSYGMGISRAFLKEKRLNVAVNTTALFHKYMIFKEETYAPTFYSWEQYKTPQRFVAIKVSWRLGDLKAKVKKTERSINNDDVKEGGRNTSGMGVGGR